VVDGFSFFGTTPFRKTPFFAVTVQRKCTFFAVDFAVLRAIPPFSAHVCCLDASVTFLTADSALLHCRNPWWLPVPFRFISFFRAGGILEIFFSCPFFPTPSAFQSGGIGTLSVPVSLGHVQNRAHSSVIFYAIPLFQALLDLMTWLSASWEGPPCSIFATPHTLFKAVDRSARFLRPS